MKTRKVYLDYASTTPLAPEVKKAMEPFWNDNFGNPMALNSYGQNARKEIEMVRGLIAKFFRMDQEEIIFTGGATESNNLAVKGITEAVGNWVKKYSQRIFLNNPDRFIPHVITTQFEHHCLLDSVKYLKEKGLIEADFIKTGKDGLVDTENIKKSIKPNTVLISVMYVNNEVGTIQPIEKIGKLVKKERKERKQKAGMKNKEALPIYLHSDITQGLNYLPCPMNDWGVDAFSFSAHKIYGPKGVGALGVNKKVLIEKQQHGGGQEFNMRSGTHNVPGIIGLGAALERAGKRRIKEAGRLKKLQKYFWEQVKKEIKGADINGSMEKRVANNLNISFEKVEGESVLMALDMVGIACTTGSACSSESLKTSHVLSSMGLSNLRSHGSIRFSMGESTNKEVIDYTVKQLKEIIDRLRKMSGGIKIG